jgi:phage tail sheath protein FI
MPATFSYPGLYLEEIPSNAHSIVAAPTSIAVFVGYSHPLKTDPATFGQPIRLSSFSDYESVFGGIYVSSTLDCNLGHAIYQFFLNGGSDAYAVGLQGEYQISGGPPQPITAATQLVATTGGGIVFEAKELTDSPNTALTVTINNVRSSSGVPGDPLDTADYTFTYLTRVESYRGVLLTADGLPPSSLPQALTIAGVNKASSLIQITPSGNYGTAYANPNSVSVSLTTPPVANLIGTFSELDFTSVFQADQPLDKVQIFNLLIVPGVSDNGVLSAALAFAERKQAFVIMDPPANCGADQNIAVPTNDMNAYFVSGAVPLSQNGALYFPYLKTSNPLTGDAMSLPPSGYVAGVCARTDATRGVWKAPAGLEAIVNNTIGVVDSGQMTDPRQGVLNLTGINCLRTFSGLGTVVFGSRTLVSFNTAFQDYKYVPVRRMALFIEQTLLQNLKWVVFEPNDEPLWLAIRMTIENFMLSLFNQNALQGSTPSSAFQVKCDSTTTSPDDQTNGIVNIVVAFAPLKPAEFVVIKIAQLAGQTQA